MEVKAIHVAGQRNILADALSRNNLNLFFAQDPKARGPNRGAHTAGGSAGDGSARLDVASQVPTAHRLFMAGLAPSTRSAYELGARRYLKFCQAASRAPFPVREEMLSLFISMLHVEGLAPGTVKSYQAAVTFGQNSGGMGDPRIGRMPQLEYVMKGIKRSTKKKVGPRLPTHQTS